MRKKIFYTVMDRKNLGNDQTIAKIRISGITEKF